MTGIAGCCARAVSGHAAAAPPSSVMNSRRLMGPLNSSGYTLPLLETENCLVHHSKIDQRMTGVGHGTNPLARESAARRAAQVARAALTDRLRCDDGAGVPS